MLALAMFSKTLVKSQLVADPSISYAKLKSQDFTHDSRVVVVFFTLTDRASTIPNNTRGCQSGTWSAGQKKIRGTSTKLQ